MGFSVMTAAMRGPLVSLLLSLSLALGGCADATAFDQDAEEEAGDESGEVVETSEEAVTSCRARAESTMKVVSANIHEGGVGNDANKRERNWATMDKFVSLATSIDAKVLAVQETVSAASADRLLSRLNAVSGKPWAKQDTVSTPGWAIKTALYWRTDDIDLVESLGHRDLGKLDSNGYTIRFHGVLLRSRAGGELFSVFTGKLPWTNDQENFRMAPELRDWVRDVTAPYPSAPRIIAMDMNAPLGSRTWKLFSADYDDSGAKLATFPSSGWFSLRKRIDYIWVDRNSGARESCAFVEPVRRSMHFGSDHRFVWGDVYLPRSVAAKR
jgi:endonuclease/exonuclease/phosphatase family metal-dependent hydrolase